MATTASQAMPSSTRTTGESTEPTQLSRERSQPELEAAQHLIEHSQSIRQRQAAESPRSEGYTHYVGESSDAPMNVASTSEHYEPDDRAQVHAQPFADAHGVLSATPVQQRAPSNSTTPSGQMCR